MSDSVAVQLADIFSSEVDFHRDLRPGDRFAVVFEAFYSNGEFVRTGRIVAAEFTNAGRTYRAVYFQDTQGRGGYYTPEGKNMRKTFLRSPLEFSRISSGFSTSRLHPILNSWRAHKGVDYAAPGGHPRQGHSRRLRAVRGAAGRLRQLGSRAAQQRLTAPPTGTCPRSPTGCTQGSGSIRAT